MKKIIDGVLVELSEAQALAFEAERKTEATKPAHVTRWQILTGLARQGWITEAEAEAALATGARPAAVEAVINGLPEGERFAARMKWIGFQAAYRDDPMVEALAAIEGKTPQEVDEFFALCAGIE